MPDKDTLRVLATFVCALVGVAVVFVIFNVTRGYAADKEQATVVVGLAGTAMSMIGTLVGFVSGQAAGAVGKEKAEERAEKATERASAAEKRASLLSALAEPEAVRQALASHPELFR